LGAALHAAWVWLKEKGSVHAIRQVVSRFVILDESRRKKPHPANRDVYRHQKRLYEALSRRVRGLEGEDPFRLRAELMDSHLS
jgi:hypothetical protein